MPMPTGTLHHLRVAPDREQIPETASELLRQAQTAAPEQKARLLNEVVTSLSLIHI